MRIMIHKYMDGGDYMVEKTDDGSAAIRLLDGTRGEAGKLMSAFLDVSCRDDEESMDRLLEGLSWLKEEVGRRKPGRPEKKEMTKTKKSPKTAGAASPPLP